MTPPTQGTLIKRASLAVLLSLALGSTGCLTNFANGDTIIGPTVGKQLIDLERARERNLVSQEEYESLRKQIIERGPLLRGPSKGLRDDGEDSDEHDGD